MEVKCPKCGVELELSDDVCVDGSHFKCCRCSTWFSYYNGEAFALKVTRVSVPHDRKPRSAHHFRDGSHGSTEETESQALAAVKRRWKGFSTRGRMRVYIAASIVSVVVLLAILFQRTEGGVSADLKDMHDNLLKLEKKYGTNSVEYIEARLDMIRTVDLPVNTAMVKIHRAFISNLKDAGYMVTNQIYSDDRLVSLLIINMFSGEHGFTLPVSHPR